MAEETDPRRKTGRSKAHEVEQLMTSSDRPPSYPNPPIVEALVQFSFKDPLVWSVATPGLVYQHLRDSYPEEPEQQDQIEASLQVQGESSTAGLSVSRGNVRVIFRDATKSRLVVLNSSTLSVNCLKPYEGWPALSGRLHDAWQSFSAAGFDPQIRTVTTRYINQITVAPDGPAINLAEYFTLEVRSSTYAGAVVGGFLSRVESVLPDSTRVTLTFASSDDPTSPDPSSAHFIVDIEVSRSSDEGWTPTEAEKIAAGLKRIENAEFESIITDKCRKLFQ